MVQCSAAVINSEQRWYSEVVVQCNGGAVQWSAEVMNSSGAVHSGVQWCSAVVVKWWGNVVQ